MSHRTASLAALAGAVLALAAPAAASAVTGTIGKPCYSHVPAGDTEPIVVTLAGGTPGANFLVAATSPGKGSGSAGSASGTFDAAGNGVATITSVFPPSGSITPIKGEPLIISVEDFGAGGVETPIGSTLITTLTMDIASKPVSPRAHRRITVSGTPFAGQALYGFVTKGKSPKILRRISLGTADGCGYLSAKGIVAPKNYRRGSYRFYINAGPRLDKEHALAFSFSINRRAF